MAARTDNAVDAAGISKRFRFPTGSRRPTIKDAVVRPRVVVEKGYGTVQALDDVSFSLPHGRALGVIGENGSGKTTLMRILSGITQPDRGEVRTRGSIAPLLALGAGFNPYLTGRENALIELLTLGMSRAEAKKELDAVIAFSELEEFIDAPIRTYSSGMTMRLAFAAAIRVDPDILLLDEILAVGDERFATKCIAWLRNFRSRGKTTILVTHSTADVVEHCDLALWLDRGRVAAFGDKLAVVRAYLREKSGRPVADVFPVQETDSIESVRALAETYRSRLFELLPLLRLPLVGYVRQRGTVKGAYEDGWTDGALEFSFEALRDVSGWTVRTTVPESMPEDAVVDLAVGGSIVCREPAVPGPLELRSTAPVRAGTEVNVRVGCSATVNQSALGLGADVRSIALRVDEIVFEHAGDEVKSNAS